MQRFLRALCTLLVFCPALLFSQPKIDIVGGLSFDFGTLYSTMKVKRTITMRNEGTDTLVITELSTSCGCTAALLSHPRIAPSGTGTVEISFDPTHFFGKVEKAISMKTNDPKNPTPHVKFTANVLKILEISPDYIVFKATAGKPATERLTIKNVTNEPFNVTSASASSDLVAVGKFDKTLRPQAPVNIALTFTPQTSGTLTGDITLKTDNPNVPVITVRFFSLVKEKGAAANSSK